jgi:hypothetical protein
MRLADAVRRPAARFSGMSSLSAGERPPRAGTRDTGQGTSGVDGGRASEWRVARLGWYRYQRTTTVVIGVCIL